MNIQQHIESIRNNKADLIAFLESHCEGSSNDTIYIRLSPEQLTERKAYLTEEILKYDQMVESHQLIKDDLKAKEKEFSTAIKSIKKVVRTGIDERDGVVYTIADRDNAKMLVVDEFGEILSVRSMRMDERQLHLEVNTTTVGRSVGDGN